MLATILIGGMKTGVTVFIQLTTHLLISAHLEQALTLKAQKVNKRPGSLSNDDGNGRGLGVDAYLRVPTKNISVLVQGEVRGASVVF